MSIHVVVVVIVVVDVVVVVVVVVVDVAVVVADVAIVAGATIAIAVDIRYLPVNLLQDYSLFYYHQQRGLHRPLFR